MKKVRKIIKVIILVAFSVIVASGIGGISYYFAVTHSVTLSADKLSKNNKYSGLKILDINKNLITNSNQGYAKITELSTHTKNAFISAEDKRFYKHKGIDPIRIGGAIVSNIKTKSFSEGASTISQQLIKNTHLSNEKTINRKLQEIKLTTNLEKNYSKDEILELYLNNIYFGNGTYGIENASKYYFGKSAKYLTLSESAMLAGTINAPSVYDIENKTENAIARRNLILKQMHKNGKITNQERVQATNEKVKLNFSHTTSTKYIYSQILKEASQILSVSENELSNNNLTIETYIDLSVQQQVCQTISENYKNITSSPEIASIVIDNKTHGIVAVTGSSQTLQHTKQPGSSIKPILVFAPAIENGTITKDTKLLDENINISGYSPENADHTYHGMVSATEALKNSYNIPAVKLLNEIGISYAQNFAKKLGIEFDENDNNLSIALGGFTKGISLKSLVEAYSSFACDGNWAKSVYIKSISKNGKLIYTHKTSPVKAISTSTVNQINEMLIETAKTGTAKRLCDLDYQIASKTGTVGKQNSKTNTDAFNVSYTSSHTILSYFGGKNLPSKINGSTYPTMLTKDICNILYAKNHPQNLLNNSPKTISNNSCFVDEKSDINPTLIAHNFKNKKPILTFLTEPNYSYKLVRIYKKKEEIIFFQDITKNAKIINFEDKTASKHKIYEYFLQITDNEGNQKTSNTAKLKSN